MTRLIRTLRNHPQDESADRRPRMLRRILPVSYATSVPLTGTQMAKIHLAAFH